jgi:hypothetical protein
MKNRVCLTLVGIPFLGRFGKAFRTEGNGLVLDGAVLLGEDLEKNSTDSVFASITPNDPGQVITREVEGAGLGDALLEPVEVGFIIVSPGSNVPVELVMSHFVELGRPLRVVGDVVVEKEGCSKK